MRRYEVVILMLWMLFATRLATAQVLFYEDFESAAVNTPYAWTYNSANTYSDNFNMPVFISSYPQHEIADVGNKVLFLDETECKQIFTEPIISLVKMEYDLLFHKSDSSEWGSVFGNQFLTTDTTGRHGTNLDIYKGYPYAGVGDGTYFYDNFSNKNQMVPGIEMDKWYHIARMLNPITLTEILTITDKSTAEEYLYSFNLTEPIPNITGFGFAVSYPGSYKLIDNIRVETIPEPATLSILLFGVLGIKRLKF